MAACAENSIYEINEMLESCGYASLGSFSLVQLLKQCCNFPQFMPVGKPMKYSSEVLEHLSDNIISNESSKIIGYRYDVTGVFGYDFGVIKSIELRYLNLNTKHSIMAEKVKVRL